MPNLGDGDGFLRDEYDNMYRHEQLHDGEGNAPPDLQDSGLTLNFKRSNDDHYQKIEDILHDLDQTHMIHFSPNEMRSIQDELENEKNHDQLTADFHGMRFHFNRDQVKDQYAGWSAHQMAYDQYGGSQSTMPSLPEIAYYGVPLLLFAITVFVVMCGVGMCCGCIMAHYRMKQRNRKESVITKILEYKAVPVEEIGGDIHCGP